MESLATRKKLDSHFGADVVVDFQQMDPVEEIMRLPFRTGGEGDSAIRVLGAQATFEACIKCTRPGVTISFAGCFGKGDCVKIPRLEWV